MALENPSINLTANDLSATPPSLNSVDITRNGKTEFGSPNGTQVIADHVYDINPYANQNYPPQQSEYFPPQRSQPSYSGYPPPNFTPGYGGYPPPNSQQQPHRRHWWQIALGIGLFAAGVAVAIVDPPLAPIALIGGSMALSTALRGQQFPYQPYQPQNAFYSLNGGYLPGQFNTYGNPYYAAQNSNFYGALSYPGQPYSGAFGYPQAYAGGYAGFPLGQYPSNYANFSIYNNRPSGWA